MLVIFKSKAAADVIMYEENAKPILDLLGKDLKRGIITAAESAGAIATLETEIAASSERASDNDADEDHERHRRERVSFATRVFPLLEMLRAANKHSKDVMWGV
ncbi:MAG: hypothetical protein K0S28_199 [Paucimonas sp.]|jgi:hypothetical protein|nr:hypothetical protein [Paucimonas sp.]